MSMRRDWMRAIRRLAVLATVLSWFAVDPAVTSAHGLQVAPPIFTEEPKDNVVGEGVVVEIRAAATGTGWLDLVFQRSLDGGGTWADVGGCGGDGEVTGSCAIYPTATLDLDGSLWRAVVTGEGGTTVSREALLRVCSESTCWTDDFALSPSLDLVSGQVVQVTGSRFPGSAQLILSICVVNSRLCSDRATATTNSTGNLATAATMVRTISMRSDCLRTACEMRALLPGGNDRITLASAPLDFLDVQPDLRQRRRSDGTIFFDDVYTIASNPPMMSHTIDPGGVWTFAVQVQNDGDVTDDITVTGAAPSYGITGRYFLGWYDISAAIDNGGFTFRDVPPGEVITFALRFQAPPDAFAGMEQQAALIARSGIDPEAVDYQRFRVFVPTPS
jgi:hypothetical protein